jgi:uncharacterized membrane protein
MAPAGLTTLAKGDDSRVVESRRFVVRDPRAFAAVWSAHAGPDAPVPEVDFDTTMVAAVFAGERPTPGYEVSIADARREGSALVLVVDELAPDPSQVAAQVLVSPYHVVTLPRDDGEIRFDKFDTESEPGQGTIVFKPRATPREAMSYVEHPPSSTGLAPEIAGALAYLAGPFSGALILATERTSPFVRFHAWQSVLGLGSLGVAALLFLLLAFALLIVSSTLFWISLWIAAIAALLWVLLWGFCVVQAYKGRRLKLPIAGAFAERHA